MMRSKRFFWILVGVLFFICSINLLMWHMLVKTTFYGMAGHGDLSRLGSFVFANESLTVQHHCEKKHFEFADYKKKPETIDVLTIGDSFSNGGGGYYYQDYMASAYGLNVLNISSENFNGNALAILSILNNSGYLKEIKPKVIIIQSVERFIGERFQKKYMANRFSNINNIKVSNSRETEILDDKFFNPIMFKANIKYMINKVYSLLFPGEKSSSVSFAFLKSNLFSNDQQENLLLYYSEDKSYLYNKIDSTLVNEQINCISKELENENIKLVFLPIPDKFDLYYPYLNSTYQVSANQFLEELKLQPKSYLMIDAKGVLRNALSQGETDIYWSDDTHWSWKGANIVVDETMKCLNIHKMIFE